MRMAITIPGPPQPKERARQGRGRRWYTPERTRRYEAAVREQMILHAPCGWPADAEYAVEMRAYFPDARGRDLDNVCKACCDAGNECLWADDRQVVRVTMERAIDRENPRTELVITVLDRRAA